MSVKSMYMELSKTMWLSNLIECTMTKHLKIYKNICYDEVINKNINVLKNCEKRACFIMYSYWYNFMCRT